MSDTTDSTNNETTLPEPASRRRTLWSISLGIVLALAIAGVGWVVLRGADGDGPVRAVNGPGRSGEPTQAVEPTGTVEGTSTPGIEPEGGNGDPEYDPNADPPFVEQYLAIITDVKESGGSYVVTVDYVQFVVGDEAKNAAEAHGDTVPASGIYVVNDNPLTRKRPVASGLTVRVALDKAGAPDQVGRSLPLDEWAVEFESTQTNAYRSGTYVLTLTNGTVTMLEQLYMP